MSSNSFLLLTAIAGIAFGYALLWVVTQWLKADENVGSVEREVEIGMEKLAAHVPMLAVPVGTTGGLVGSSDTMARPAGDIIEGYLADDDSVDEHSDTEEEQGLRPGLTAEDDEAEMVLGRHLLIAGTFCTFVGMAAGWAFFGALGGLGGAVFGSFLGVLAATAMVAIQRGNDSKS